MDVMANMEFAEVLKYAWILFLYPAVSRGINWWVDNRIAKQQRKVDLELADNIPGIDPGNCFREILVPGSGKTIMTASYISKIEDGRIHVHSLVTGGTTSFGGARARDLIWISLPHPDNFNHRLTCEELMRMPNLEKTSWLYKNCGITKSIFGTHMEKAYK